MIVIPAKSHLLALTILALTACSEGSKQEELCATAIQKSLQISEPLEIYDFNPLKNPAGELRLSTWVDAKQKISSTVNRCNTEADNLPLCEWARDFDQALDRAIVFVSECGKDWSCYSMRYKAATQLGPDRTSYCGVSKDGHVDVLDMLALTDALTGTRP